MSAPVAPSAPVTILAGELAQGLAAPRALAKAGALPHHRTVALEARDAATLTLRTGNAQQEALAELAAEVTGPLSLTLDTEAFAAVVAQLDPKAPVRLGRDAAGLTLAQGRRRVRLPEAPAVPGEPLFPAGRGRWVSVPRARLAALVAAAEAYPVLDDVRAHLAGLHLAGLRDWLFVGGSDGHRALVARERVEGVGCAGGSEAWSAFVPRVAFERWRALLSASHAETCELRVSDGGHAPVFDGIPGFGELSNAARGLRESGRAALRVGGSTLSAVTLSVTPAEIGALAEYPDHQATHVVARLAPAEALRACKALAVTTESGDVSPSVRARADAGGVYLRSEAATRGGDTEEQLDAMVALSGPLASETVAVNVRYLRDALESAVALGTDDVDLAWNAIELDRGASRRVSSIWVVRPTGYTLADAPWWTVTMGLAS